MYEMVTGGWRGLIFPNTKDITAIQLPQFEMRPSGLPFAYSLVGILCYKCSKTATGSLKIFQSKKLIVSKPISSIPYHFICDYIANYIKRPWNLSLHIVLYS